MDINIAYLKKGQLHLKLHHAPVRIINSEFGQVTQERLRQIQKRNFLRNRGPMANFVPPEMLKAMDQREEPETPVNFSSICLGEDGQLFYALSIGSVSGVFCLDSDFMKEKRLFHGSDHAVEYLDINNNNLIACVTRYANGTANIATMSPEGSRLRDITEGDSIDIAPHWIPGINKALVFQSAGLGRNSQGFVVEKSPFRIEKLDFDRQEIETLVADPQTDYLSPQMSSDGSLYYISRPYTPIGKSFNILDILKDIVLMPFRLLYALFQMLNFFTMRFTGKPLQTGGNPQNINSEQMNAWGEQIDVEKATKANRFGDADAPSLVPRSWELIKRNSNNETTVIAQGVLAFDLNSDGTILYTNGSGIYYIDENGVSKRLLVDKLIQQVAFLNK